MADFDFLHGSWIINNRKLRARLVESDDWQEFVSTSECRSLFGGAANIDEIVFADGSAGLTLRLFDVARREWTLHWSSSDSGRLFPPVVGRFTGGVGEFFGDDTEGAKPVRVRFVWSRTEGGSPRWEQAFSTDGEKTWETNWYMDLTRAG